ncbi:helix-turn-helix domain-containing protein [Streptomyces sp. NPDC059849]|uniref:helix-turn-helix domain-containing protein n=1 Tax=Streptomyces sp. NPDC059849 TaxID=3346969 RepID=UPI003656BDAF
MPTSSHKPPPDPGPPARKGSATDAERAARCSTAVHGMAVDAVRIAETFAARASDPSAVTTDLLECTVQLTRLMEDTTAALVVRQRSRGEPLTDLEPVLKVSADRLRRKYPPRTVDRELATRKRPALAFGSQRAVKRAMPKKASLRDPHQRLACALTLMWKQSGIPQRELALRMNIHRSYLSRILSGERSATLAYVELIAKECAAGTETEFATLLWKIAADAPVSTTDPVHTLRTYFQALNYAAGSPREDRLLSSTRRSITAADLRRAFHGPGVPQWAVYHRLATALQSKPEIALPLWRNATHGRGPGSSLPADAFG